MSIPKKGEEWEEKEKGGKTLSPPLFIRSGEKKGRGEKKGKRGEKRDYHLNLNSSLACKGGGGGEEKEEKNHFPRLRRKVSSRKGGGGGEGGGGEGKKKKGGGKEGHTSCS